MRKLFSFALSTCFVAGMAMAAPQGQDQSAPSQQEQHAGHRRANPERRVQMLSKRLNLTADQQSQLLPILTDRQEKMQAIFHDSSLSKEDRMTKMRSLREDSESKIKAILTDEQKQTYDQMQQQSRERAHDRRNAHKGAAGDSSSAQ
jgi:periplasmic protein CpxP/Spy